MGHLLNENEGSKTERGRNRKQLQGRVENHDEPNLLNEEARARFLPPSLLLQSCTPQISPWWDNFPPSAQGCKESEEEEQEAESSLDSLNPPVRWLAFFWTDGGGSEGGQL